MWSLLRDVVAHPSAKRLMKGGHNGYGRGKRDKSNWRRKWWTLPSEETLKKERCSRLTIKLNDKGTKLRPDQADKVFRINKSVTILTIQSINAFLAVLSRIIWQSVDINRVLYPYICVLECLLSEMLCPNPNNDINASGTSDGHRKNDISVQPRRRQGRASF